MSTCVSFTSRNMNFNELFESEYYWPKIILQISQSFLSSKINNTLLSEYKNNYSTFLRIEYLYNYTQKILVSNVAEMFIELLKINYKSEIAEYFYFLINEFKKTPIYLNISKIFIKNKMYKQVFRCLTKKNFFSMNSIVEQKTKNLVIRDIDLRIFFCFQIKTLLKKILTKQYSNIISFFDIYKRIGKIREYDNISALLMKIGFIFFFFNTLVQGRNNVFLNVCKFFFKLLFSVKVPPLEWFLVNNDRFHINNFFSLDVFIFKIFNDNFCIYIRKLIYVFINDKKECENIDLLDFYLFVDSIIQRKNLKLKSIVWVEFFKIWIVIQERREFMKNCMGKYVGNFNNVTKRTVLKCFSKIKNKKYSKEKFLLVFLYQYFKKTIKNKTKIYKIKNKNLFKRQYNQFGGNRICFIQIMFWIKDTWFKFILKTCTKNFFIFKKSMACNICIGLDYFNILYLVYFIGLLSFEHLIILLILFGQTLSHNNQNMFYQLKFLKSSILKNDIEKIFENFNLGRKRNENLQQLFMLDLLVIRIEMENIKSNLDVYGDIFYYSKSIHYNKKNFIKDKNSTNITFTKIITELDFIDTFIKLTITFITGLLLLKTNTFIYLLFKNIMPISTFFGLDNRQFHLYTHNFPFIILLKKLVWYFIYNIFYLDNLENFIFIQKENYFWFLIFFFWSFIFRNAFMNRLNTMILSLIEHKLLYKKKKILRYTLIKNVSEYNNLCHRNFFILYTWKKKNYYESSQKIDEKLHSNFSLLISLRIKLEKKTIMGLKGVVLFFLKKKSFLYNNITMVSRKEKISYPKFLFLIRLHSILLYHYQFKLFFVHMNNIVLFILISFNMIIDLKYSHRAAGSDPALKKYIKIIRDEVFNIIFEARHSVVYEKLNQAVTFWIDCQEEKEKKELGNKNMLIKSPLEICLDHTSVLIKNNSDSKFFLKLTPHIKNYVKSSQPKMKISNIYNETQLRIRILYTKKIVFFLCCLNLLYQRRY
nr:hypothetical protein 1634Bnrm1_p008 [Cryptomonas sp.]